MITNESRCICRFCRLRKCFDVGMKPSAIQRRDVMGPRKPKSIEKKKSVEMFSPQMRASSTPSTAQHSDFWLLDQLIRLQERQRRRHTTTFCMQETFSFEADMFDRYHELINRPKTRRARAADVNMMIRIGIMDSAQWANQFEPFHSLEVAEKRLVLTEYAFAFMLIDQGYLTAYQQEDDLWMLQNNTYMHADYFKGLPEEEKAKCAKTIKAKFHPHFVKDALDLVGRPMKLLKIDKFECAALKTFLLLTYRKFYETSAKALEKAKNRCLAELMEYCIRKCPQNSAERAGNVILMAGNIRSCIRAVYEQTRVSDVFDFMKFDDLVRDVILS